MGEPKAEPILFNSAGESHTGSAPETEGGVSPGAAEPGGTGKQVFRSWDVEQFDLFPAAPRDLVPASHLVHFLRRVVRDDLDLSGVYAKYTAPKGQPPYHPGLMTALLLYGYCRAVYTSRRLEIACEERLDFRALVGAERPDHSTIAQFRKDHREALSGLFVQVLALCRDAGMAKLGHVALDGTKVKANASKHAAMSYARMKEAEPELAKLVEEWMEASRQGDEADDDEHGPGPRGDEIPAWVQEKAKRLARVRASMARLEEQAKAEAERVTAQRAAREAEQGGPLRGPVPKALDGAPADKAQSNFTDPESRIMKTADGYEQAYNAQAAVDAESQVIVAQAVITEQNDIAQLAPMVDQVEENMGERPQQVSADTGYCSEENLGALEDRQIDGYVATGRQKHGTPSATSGEERRQGPRSTAMREKLRQGGHESPYRLRKQTVEPVFGQIKEARGFRTFLRRGLANVRGEWALICTAHNLLKLAARQAADAAAAG
jgi:transposase